MKDPKNILLEVGPGQTLSTLARQHPAKSAEQTVLASLPLVGAQEPRGLLEALGRLWMTGVTVDWQSFYANERRRRVVLPTYPFERTATGRNRLYRLQRLLHQLQLWLQQTAEGILCTQTLPKLRL